VGVSARKAAPLGRRLLQFRLRTLLILVASVALVLGAEHTRRRWKTFRQEAASHGHLAKVYSKMASFNESFANEAERSAMESVMEYENMNMPSRELFLWSDRQLRGTAEQHALARKTRENASRFYRDAVHETQLEQEYLRRW
jgi:hypothetical protein